MQILSICIGSGGFLGVLLTLLMIAKWVGKIEQRFDSSDKSFVNMDKRMEDQFKGMDKRIVAEFESINKRFDLLIQDVKEIRKDLRGIDIRLSMLEVRVEERTLRVFHARSSGIETELEKVNAGQ